jgi:hypothetical protein
MTSFGCKNRVKINKAAFLPRPRVWRKKKFLTILLPYNAMYLEEAGSRRE